MTEPQKGTNSAVGVKEKASMLDLDFGKDFLSSWKDDGLDFDLGSAVKGKKTSFKFDKMDMDFNLDTDFGKLSSFKIDMSDLDITSPLKKAGKIKERSDEVSPGANNQANRDNFNFPFDFNEFGTLNFETKSTKADGKSKENQASEGSPKTSGREGFESALSKEVDAVEDNTPPQIPASLDMATTNIASKVRDAKALDTSNEDVCLKPVIDDSCSPNPTNFEDKFITRRENSPEKTTAASLHDMQEESHQPEKTSSENSVQETVHVLSEQSVDNTSAECPSDLQEEVSTLDGNLSSPTRSQQNEDFPLTAGSESINGTSLPENLPLHNMMNSPQNNCDNVKSREDSDVLISKLNGTELTNDYSHLDHNTVTRRPNKLLHELTPDERNWDSNPELYQAPLKSRITGDELAVKEIETGVNRSIIVKRPNETESKLQQTSFSHTKLISTSSTQRSPVDGKRDHDIEELQSRKKLNGTSRSLPRDLATEKPVQTGNLESMKGLNSTMSGVSRSLPRDLAKEKPVQTENAESIKGLNSTLNGISRSLPRDLAKEKSFQTGNAESMKGLNSTGRKVQSSTDKMEAGSKLTSSALLLKGSDKKMLNSNALCSDVHTSGSNEHANKCTSQNCLNSRHPLSRMPSLQSMKKTVLQNTSSHVTAGRKTPELSGQKVPMQTIGASMERISSSSLKDFTSMRNTKSNLDLPGNLASKRPYSADRKKQTPPTSTLKRRIEESTLGMLTLTPSKRLSASPSESRNTKALSDRVITKQVFQNEDVTDDNTGYADTSGEVNITEVDITLAIESDANVEKAEACSKELDDICSMLKKKHDEAKEILVRAIVNNNNLLMLNHPVYQEKILKIQKFAASIMLNTLRT